MEIDITDLVEKARSTFVLWGVDFLFATVVAQPGFQWVAFPFFAYIFKQVLTYLLNTLSNSAVMEAFFFNTALRKASQAGDYVNSVNAKNSLPVDVSDADYEKAEAVEIIDFTNFVCLTN